MMEETLIIPLPSLAHRLVLLLALLLVLGGAGCAVCWYMGNTLAEYGTGSSVEDSLRIAQAATRLAPSDPLPHWTLGALKTKNLPLNELPSAAHDYLEAVRLSPRDYRLWIDLGLALERAGETNESEQALRRAVELAPAFASPRWFLGNLLLREGRTAEAFAELRLAGEKDESLRAQTIELAWTIYGEDTAAFIKAAGDSSAARARLATYLGARGEAEEALRWWSGLSIAEKQEQSVAAQALMKSLLDAGRYNAALELERSLAPEGASIQNIDEFRNAGFESDVDLKSASAFEWHIKTAPQALIDIDAAQKHNGGRSLRIVFNAHTFADFSQLVPVQPATSYQLECYARTAGLKSVSLPLIEVVAGTGGSVLAASKPLPAGDHEWQPVTVNFNTPPHTEAVTIRTNREPCKAGAGCPILGTVWYDDFKLRRAGANPGPVKEGGLKSSDAVDRGAR